MSESKHTQGPWKASRRKGEEWGVSYPYEYGDWGGVQVWMIGAFPEADARLISAAPDLLAACEAAEIVMDTVAQLYGSTLLGNSAYADGWVEAHRALQAAIRKARGEQA